MLQLWKIDWQLTVNKFALENYVNISKIITFPVIRGESISCDLIKGYESVNNKIELITIVLYSKDKITMALHVNINEFLKKITRLLTHHQRGEGTLYVFDVKFSFPCGIINHKFVIHKPKRCQTLRLISDFLTLISPSVRYSIERKKKTQKPLKQFSFNAILFPHIYTKHQMRETKNMTSL